MVTALVETSTGVALLFAPQLVAGLLLGASLEAPAALIVGRVAGAALLALGVRLGLAGPLIWPAVALHLALAVWCVASIRAGR